MDAIRQFLCPPDRGDESGRQLQQLVGGAQAHSGELFQWIFTSGGSALSLYGIGFGVHKFSARRFDPVAQHGTVWRRRKRNRIGSPWFSERTRSEDSVPVTTLHRSGDSLSLGGLASTWDLIKLLAADRLSLSYG